MSNRITRRAALKAAGTTFAAPFVWRLHAHAAPSETVLHASFGASGMAGAATICLGAEREGLPGEVVSCCERQVTIPLRGGAESLNVAAAAAIAAQRISSPAMDGGQPDA